MFAMSGTMARLSWPEVRFRFRPLTWALRLVQLLAAFMLALHIYAAALILIDPPATAVMAERGLQGEKILYHPADLEDISPNLVRAVIAAEDTKFCQAVDPSAVLNETQAGRSKQSSCQYVTHDRWLTQTF